MARAVVCEGAKAPYSILLWESRNAADFILCSRKNKKRKKCWKVTIELDKAGKGV